MSDFRKAPPAPPEANLGNITPFRPDRRRQVCGLLKSLSVLGLLCFLIYSVWNYHEQLSLTNLRRMAAYLSDAWASGGMGAAGVSFPFEADSVYCSFGDGLAALSGDTLSFINAQGQEQLRAQLKYANPALSAAADNLLAYDRGGKSLCLTNRYAALWQIQLESDIISASVNYNGAFSVVTDEQGYRAAVTLYDNRKKPRFKWSTSEYYIMKSCVSPDARRLAALCMSEEGGRRVSVVRVFATDREEPLFDIPLGDLTVYSMEYYEQDSLMLVTDRGVFSYDEEGQERGRFEYSKGAAVTFWAACLAWFWKLERKTSALGRRLLTKTEGWPSTGIMPTRRGIFPMAAIMWPCCCGTGWSRLRFCLEERRPPARRSTPGPSFSGRMGAWF